MFGPIAGFGTPKGIDFGTLFNIFDYIKHGVLIGRIRTANSGLTGGWFYIGNEKDIVAQTSGVLDLNVNDTYTSDNLEFFKVRVCKID